MRGVTVLVASISQKTTSSIATKRGIGMGSDAFSDVYSKGYRRNVKPEKLRKWCDFQKNVQLIYMFGQRYQQVGNRVISKFYMADYTCKLVD